MEKLLSSFNADILCFQETKLTRTELTEKLAKLKDYYAFWSFCRKRKGYSGVVTYVKQSVLFCDYKSSVRFENHCAQLITKKVLVDFWKQVLKTFFFFPPFAFVG